MKKIVRLTESDLTRIVKNVINENINRSTDEYEIVSRKVRMYLNDLNTEMRKGDPKKIEEVKYLVLHQIRNLENVLSEIKTKLR